MPTPQPPSGAAPDPDVAAQVDQHPAAQFGRDGRRGPVRGQRLGGGAQVEHRPGGHPHLAERRVELHAEPARSGGGRLAQRGSVPPGPGEVPVVAEADQRGPAGGVHVPVGEPGRGQGDRQRLAEQRADPDRASPGVIDPPQLGTPAEPGTGRIHRQQFRGQQRMGLLQRGGLGGQQRGEGAEGAARAVSQCSGGGWHQPPPWLGLEVVCTGLGAGLGGGAGGVAGGARDCEGAGPPARPAGL